MNRRGSSSLGRPPAPRLPRRVAAAALALLAAAGATAQPVLGSAGAIDRSFGKRGLATTGLSRANGLAARGDGSSVVVGSVLSSARLNQTAAVRLTAGGAKDRSFGRGGTAVAPGRPGSAGSGFAVLQRGGRIVLAGGRELDDATPLLGPASRFTVDRLLADGRSDRAFGRGGGVVLPPLSSGTFTARFAYALGVAAQTDGKVVIVGAAYSRNPGILLGQPVPESRLAVVRLCRNGALDASFGRGGVALIPVRGLRVAIATSVAIVPGGRIAVAGSGSTGERSSLASTGVVARLTRSGRLDRTFGAGGVAALSVPGFDRTVLNGLVALPGGKLVAGGSVSTTGGPARFLVSRLLSSGLPDRSFGDSGLTATPDPAGGSGALRALAIDSFGRIVAVGDALYGGLPPVPPAGVLLRYRTDGVLDPTFGTAGISLGLRSLLSSAVAVAIQRPSGALLVLGTSAANTNAHGVVRVSPR